MNPELTVARRNKRAPTKDAFTSGSRRIRDRSAQTNSRSKQGNVDICASAQPQVSMAGKLKWSELQSFCFCCCFLPRSGCSQIVRSRQWKKIPYLPFRSRFFSPSFRNFRIRFLIWQFLSSFLSLQHYLRKLLRQNFSPDFFATGFFPIFSLGYISLSGCSSQMLGRRLMANFGAFKCQAASKKMTKQMVTILIQTGHPLSLWWHRA